MKQFEYMSLDCASVENLNDLGVEGWELVGKMELLLPDPNEPTMEHEALVLVLKRRLESPAIEALLSERKS